MTLQAFLKFFWFKHKLFVYFVHRTTYRHTIIYSIQMGLRRKSSYLYESVSHFKFHFTHFIEI